MSRIIITEEEKNSILGKYYSNQQLDEQKGNWVQKLMNFFSKNTADDLARNFGDDALNALNNVFAKALGNPKNFTVAGGKKLLKSANAGTQPIPMEKIEMAVEKVINGQMPKEKLINGVPRFLPDQTPFRDELSKSIDKLLAGKKTSLPKQATGTDYRAQVSQGNSKYGAGSN
jgi:hypothetical protein